MITREKFLELFPECNTIQDKSLMENCYHAFADAVESGGWDEESMMRAPCAVHGFKDTPVTGIMHMQDAVRLTTLICDDLLAHYGQYVPCNRDYVIAGAVLHDIGKFIEYRVSADGIPYDSEEANYLRHPLAGAIIAARNGIPKEVIHIIATHSFEGKESYKSVESTIVKSVETIPQKFIGFVYGTDELDIQ
ncbi:MAG: HDIG domain-containing protein [Lachnospiraceae bacterium]|nr:HDIG domain-containing protein [Lachnospiraceae bacterium]